MHVFIDESGDLGFNTKASNYFVASYLVPEDHWAITNRMKKLLRRLHKRRKYSGSELKFSNSSDYVRKYVLEKMCNLNWVTGIVVLEKRKVKRDLRKIPNVLYNYSIIHNLMRNILLWLNPYDNLNICIDKSLSKNNRDAFDFYVRDKASWIWDIELSRTPSLRRNQITTTHDDSQDECCLQLADFIAGATFQKYERGREEYYLIFEDNIRGFNYLW